MRNNQEKVETLSKHLKEKVTVMNSLNFKIFPTTRYQGSKRKLLPWLYKNMKSLNFKTALDIFGGTASVSYLFKKMGKKVTFNDYLKSNFYIGKALIENNNIYLNNSDINFLLRRHKTITYDTFVQDTFQGIYFTDDENVWIDMFLSNWNNLSNLYSNDIVLYKKSIAFSAFVQSALKKRPFNLFHRANLYLRLNNVKRSFGNKSSWDGSFDKYFIYFSKEINDAVFNNNMKNESLNFRASDYHNRDKNYDLVYIDPPYIKAGRSKVEFDYMRFYHFLEGSCDLKKWKARINYDSKNFRIEDDKENKWISPKDNRNAFENLFNIFKRSIIVISYKEPGIPTKRQLIYSLKRYKKTIVSIPSIKYDYALNKNNGFHKEYLLIGID